ncbi:MAG: hypothetical protein Alpg2KO_29730 [Alphaproteobacteria bacterium]
MINEVLRDLTATDLRELGVDDVAYIKVEQADAGRDFVVTSADGKTLLRTDEFLTAHAAIQGQAMLAVSVH